jgi:NADH dehydrogenase/NADH:ubiquinone oxidoreductase subunit G
VLHTCALRKACEAYGVDTAGYRAERPPVVLDRTHPDIVWEQGKCIRCGLCLQVAGAEGAKMGFAFVGRGFAMHLQLPGGNAAGLGELALPCAKVCPTGALASR